MKKRKDKYGRVLKEGESLRSDGRYQFRYNTIDHKRKTVYAKTLDELREKEQKLGISGMRSVNHALTPVFRTVVRDNIIRTNPIDGVFAEIKKMYDLKENKRTAVSKEQLKALISFISSSPKDSKYFNIFCTLIFTGMRVSEMCALTWEDIDFENNVIYINRSIAYTKNGKSNHIRLIQAPKTSSGIRTIPMFTGLKSILSEQKLLQENMPPVTCGEYSGFVFGNKNNLLYTADQIERILRNIVKHYNKYETEQAETSNRKSLLIDSCTPH